MADQLHGTSVQAQPPILLAPALEARSAGSEPHEESTGKEDVALTFEEEVAQFDSEQGLDEEAFSLDMSDHEVELDLEEDLAKEANKAQTESRTEEEFDFQMEPEEAAGPEEISLDDAAFAAEDKKTTTDVPDTAEPADEKDEEKETPGDEVTLSLESIDLSDLSPESDADTQTADTQEEETLDFQEEPLDFWSLSSTEEEEDAVLDKVSENIFEVLQKDETSDEEKAAKESTAPKDVSDTDKKKKR